MFLIRFRLCWTRPSQFGAYKLVILLESVSQETSQKASVRFDSAFMIEWFFDSSNPKTDFLYNFQNCNYSQVLKFNLSSFTIFIDKWRFRFTVTYFVSINDIFLYFIHCFATKYVEYNSDDLLEIPGTFSRMHHKSNSSDPKINWTMRW